MGVPVASRKSTQHGYAVDDQRYGGLPANGTDDSAAFQAVWAHCVADHAPLIVPPGTWHLASTLNPGAWQHPAIRGSGYDSTTIVQASGLTMVTAALRQNGCIFKDFTVQGGTGFYHYTYTGTSVGEYYIFRDVRFYDYTGCAIANESPDNPHLWVTGCEFRGHDFLATMGIAWCGQADAMNIVGNLFQVNRIGLKLSHRSDDATLRGPKNNIVAGNGFIRLARGATDPSAHDVWIVPGATSTGGTTGAIAFHGNKFGSENLRDATTNGTDGIANSDGQADHWMLFADEDAVGTDNSTKFPVFTDSTGGVSGVDLDESNSYNTAITGIPNSIVYSLTPWVSGCKISGYLRGASIPPYALELSADPAPATSAAALAALSFNQSNIFGPFRALHAGIDFAGIRGSNYHGMGHLVDPLGQYAGRGGISPVSGGQNPAGYVDLLTTRIASYTLVSTTRTSITDSQGGADAVEVAYGATGTARAVLGSFTPGRPVFVDFDVQTGQSGTPLTTINFHILTIGAGAKTAFHRHQSALPAGWESRRFWFTPRDAGPYTIQFSSTVAGTARIGRVNVYHAHEPISHGPVKLRQPNGTIANVGVDDTGALTGVTVTAVNTDPTRSLDILYGNDPCFTAAAGTLTAGSVYFVRLRGDGTLTNILVFPIASLTGNVQVGVYANTGAGFSAAPTGSPLSQSVSTAVASGAGGAGSGLSANTRNVIALAAAQAVSHLDYWFAIQVDSATTTWERVAALNNVGLGFSLSQTGTYVAGTMPAASSPTATGAQWVTMFGT